MNQIEQARALGQSIWYDNMSRGLLKSGELKALMDKGVSGLTSNPTIFEKAIAGSDDYDAAFVDPTMAGKTSHQVYERLILEDIRSAADLLRPVFDATAGEDGYASLEPNPELAHDTRATIAEARRLFALLDRPNVMIKVPGTLEGMPAVRQLVGEGININITLIFSLDAYRQVRDAYLCGLEEYARHGGDVSRVASVASFFVSRVDTLVDSMLEEKIKQGRAEMKPLLGKAATANCKLAYQAFKNTFSSKRFADLRTRGARVQRVLWASTSTKNPAYPDLIYVEPLVGPGTVNTLPTNTLESLLDHGKVKSTIDSGVSEAEKVLQQLDEAGISMEQVTGKLLADGVKAFSDSLHKLLDGIEQKRRRLAPLTLPRQEAALGRADLELALAGLKKNDIVERIWRRDHTVWKPGPAEISDRLGWLDVPGKMKDAVPELLDFAGEVRRRGFKQAVLLGMGGSSLGAEVASRTFGAARGYLEVTVLDSTIPAALQGVLSAIDLDHTLFIVSSKSGGTIEPMSAYKLFRARVEQAVGKARAGNHFVAITDLGTSLGVMAREQGFRRVFENPSDIGGRYSVLSLFGLVPMALAGVDIERLLDEAERMRQDCLCTSVPDNPGAWLGAVMGGAAPERDKLTLITSPAIAGFGLWVEQLIAESTGKEGKGILPIAGEPLVSPLYYRDDRLFVYLRVAGDAVRTEERKVEALRAAGFPVITYELKDGYGLGAEFFRWEFATAVAGSLLGVHPFDQPNVQQSKDITAGLLRKYVQSGRLPEVGGGMTIRELLGQAQPCNYFCINAYVRQSQALDSAFRDLRRAVVQRHGIATSLGYGPRFLHSTGQYHKGGPNSGLFLQITARHRKDIPIPGEKYGFSVLADAQALGDRDALQKAGRKVAHVKLESVSAAAIRLLAREI